MRLFTLALDYDGTIAMGDRVDADVRNAIAVSRTHGITVLLATGRILHELRRVAGDLHFVDGVIAENGAVLHFPESGHSALLGPPVPQLMPSAALTLPEQKDSLKFAVTADTGTATPTSIGPPKS